jgi:conjugal transfer pilus assembly protein TraK
MQKVLFALLALSLIPISALPATDPDSLKPSGQVNEQTIVVLPEVATQVDMSSSDVNRVACPQEQQIQDVVFSQEKGVKVKYSGPNAFIKFLFTVRNGVNNYATSPVEFYIVCGENVYNLIAAPKRIPSQTIRLSSGKLKSIKQNASLMGGLPIEKKTALLIKLAVTDTLPESFEVATPNRRFKIFKGLKIILKRTVLVDGEGLRLKEYYVTNEKAAGPGEDDMMRLNESDFMVTDLTANTLAIAMDKLNIKKDETARVFIVESTGGSVTNVN